MESKLLNILLGSAPPTPAYSPGNHQRESPSIALAGDWKRQPYGAGPSIHNHGTNNSHLALHVGAVQHREVLLITTALDTADALQFETAQVATCTNHSRQIFYCPLMPKNTPCFYLMA